MNKSGKRVESKLYKLSEYTRMVSDVWEYCTRISDTLVKCNHCAKVMSFHGTTNIRVHVGRHFGMKPVRCRSTGRLPKNIKLPPAPPTQTPQQQSLQAAQTPLTTQQIAPPANHQQSQNIPKKSSLPPLAPKPNSGNKITTNSGIHIKQPPKLLPKPVINNQPPPEVCLRWNSYHSNMQNTFPSLLNNEQFVDVTLACDGRSIKCHKVMLSACSPYMEELLSSNPCQHPIVFLKDMKFWQLQALVDFMYRGEVNVTQDKLPSLLAAAEALQIKGLASPVAPMPQRMGHLQNPHTSQQDLDDDMDQETYLRHLHLKSELKDVSADYSEDYIQDTDDSAPPTPKAKKRKVIHTPSATSKASIAKPKKDKDGTVEPRPSTSTSQSILNQAQALLQQQRRSYENDGQVVDSDGDIQNYNDDGNRTMDSHDEDLDIDEEHAKMILERYSTQNDESYNIESGGHCDDSTGSG